MSERSIQLDRHYFSKTYLADLRVNVNKFGLCLKKKRFRKWMQIELHTLFKNFETATTGTLSN
jgi:hypothetical protein